MSITTFEGPEFGTPEWWTYWKRQPKDEIIRFLQVAINVYKEKDAELLETKTALESELDRNESLSFTLFSKIKENDQLQKMVDCLAEQLSLEHFDIHLGVEKGPYPYTKEEVIDWAYRKASENEA